MCMVESSVLLSQGFTVLRPKAQHAVSACFMNIHEVNKCGRVGVFVYSSACRPAAGSLSEGVFWLGCILWSPWRPVSETPQLGSACRCQWCWCRGESPHWHIATQRKKENSNDFFFYIANIIKCKY